MMTSEKIIEDLLKKIDSIQETVANQNIFIMKMATYRDDREAEERTAFDKRTENLLNVLRDSNAIEFFSHWFFDSFSANRPKPDTRCYGRGPDDDDDDGDINQDQDKTEGTSEGAPPVTDPRRTDCGPSCPAPAGYRGNRP